ncbi:MAG: hypothetical protein ACE15C_14565 [Phycisphaerae bacterium]
MRDEPVRLISPAAKRRRGIREAILRSVHNLYAAAPEMHLAAEEIYEGFSHGIVAYERSEIDGEIVSLVQDGMIEVQKLPQYSELPRHGYRITSRGRDFVLAGFPWGKIDEFTGRQSATGM